MIHKNNSKEISNNQLDANEQLGIKEDEKYSLKNNQQIINFPNSFKMRSCTFEGKKKLAEIRENKQIYNANIQSINGINNISNNPNDNNHISEKNKNIIFSHFDHLPKIVLKLSGANGPMNKINLAKLNNFNKTSGTFGIHKGNTFYKNIINNNANIIENNNNFNPNELVEKSKKVVPSDIQYRNIIEECSNFNNKNTLSKTNNKCNIKDILKKEKKSKNFEGNNDSFIEELTDILNNVASNNNNLNVIKSDNENYDSNDKNKDNDKYINNMDIINKNNINNDNDMVINNYEDIKQIHKPDYVNQKEESNEFEDKSDKDDNEPDPRINFERINKINTSRPQTSYGGLNTRRKNLQRALQSAKYRNSTHKIDSNENNIL